MARAPAGDDRRVAELSPDCAVVLFDGDCGLCTAAVQFLLRRDRHRRLWFAARTSAFAQRLLQQHRVAAPLPESLLLVHRGRVHMRSGATLRIAALLGWPWRLLSVLLLVPWFLRDLAYRFAAANRRRWSGSVCRVPAAADRERFLDGNEAR